MAASGTEWRPMLISFGTGTGQASRLVSGPQPATSRAEGRLPQARAPTASVCSPGPWEPDSRFTAPLPEEAKQRKHLSLGTRVAPVVSYDKRYPLAVRCLLADREQLISYLRFPVEHQRRVKGDRSAARQGLRMLQDLRRQLLEPPAPIRRLAHDAPDDDHELPELSPDMPSMKEPRPSIYTARGTPPGLDSSAGCGPLATTCSGSGRDRSDGASHVGGCRVGGGADFMTDGCLHR
jgi:hypothetical protein